MNGRKLTQGQKKRQRQQVEQARLDERQKLLMALKNQQRAGGSRIQPYYPPPVLLVSENNGVLVSNWKQGWKWFSNLALGAIVAINTVPLPAEVLQALPPDTQSKVTIGLAVLGIVGRFINQAKAAKRLNDEL